MGRSVADDSVDTRTLRVEVIHMIDDLYAKSDDTPLEDVLYELMLIRDHVTELVDGANKWAG